MIDHYLFILTILIATCSFTTCIQFSNIKSFDLLPSKMKPSRKKAWFSTVTDPFLSDQTKMRIQRIGVANLFSIKVGGDDRNRTCDPLNANQVLSQLSYIPVFSNEIGCGDRIWTCDLWVMSPTSYLTAPPRDKLVGLGRLELPTSRLSGVRSNQLSYRPVSYC